MNCCNRAYKHNGISYFLSARDSLEVLSGMNAFEKLFATVDNCDFLALYTTLLNCLIGQRFSFLFKWCLDGTVHDCVSVVKKGNFSLMKWTNVEDILARPIG